jgi:hypothetical protein
MDTHGSRRQLLTVAGSLALAGCLSGGAGLGGDGSTERPGRTASPTASETGGPPTSAESLPMQYDVETLRDEVRSGGPPKDGIPAIDDPTFVGADEGPSWLDDDDVVFGIARGDDVKAYPQQVLVWHEICNDVVDGVPVSVTYCPLTGTAMGFERGATTFGVSGRLLNSNLVMYDRATESRWPQMLATAIEGPFEGESLREFRLVWTTWGAWRAAHPETALLSTETGYIRSYDRDPYGSYDPPSGYYVQDSTMFTPLDGDDRLDAKTVVVGTRAVETPVAFDLQTVRADGHRTVDSAGSSLLAVYDERFDTAYLYRVDGGQSVESVEDGTVTLGDGSSHDAGDLPFESMYAFEAMWFAWYGFYPETTLVGKTS